MLFQAPQPKMYQNANLENYPDHSHFLWWHVTFQGLRQNTWHCNL